VLNTPDTEDLLMRVALAFGIGLLIGLERGWSSREVQPGTRAAGVRTFAISGLLGGIVGALAGPPGEAIGVGGALLVGLTFATFAAVMVLFVRNESAVSGNRSATSAVAALLTFILGVYAVVGHAGIAAAAAVGAAGVLALREGIHGWIAKISRHELESGLILLAMTFIALPIMPDRPVGPFGGVNLREVWMIAIALAAVSFAGYIAVKYFGEHRGVLLSAAVGGLISSTAVALSNARRAADGEGSPRVLAAATALSMAISFARVIVIVAALSPLLVWHVAPALAAAALAAVAYGLLCARRASVPQTGQPRVEFRNPFEFWSVVFLAASMGVLILAGRLIADRFGATGTVASAAAMGLFDVDAMTVSMVRLVPTSIAQTSAAWAVLVGVASNTLTKVIIASAVGRGRFAVSVTAASVICIVAALITMLATLAIFS
jgi:uncharacterized membrane protein (DUF4010 family)